VTGTELLADGILDLPVNRWATELFALLPYSVESCHDPRSDHRSFQLGKHRGRLHNRLPPAWTQQCSLDHAATVPPSVPFLASARTR
jgi:hypothetical protein